MKQGFRLLLACIICCYLGLHHGKLAIWSTQTPAPLQVFPYSAELFPSQDYDALRRGIPFSTDEELSKLLEDFLS